MDSSGHGKQTSAREGGTHFLESADGLVRTWKESERARGAHGLDSAEGWTSLDMERRAGSDGGMRA
jgi:hypothetical protein